MEAVIQISEVNSKDVPTPNGKSATAIVYNVKAEDGREFSTFNVPLGVAAGKLRGQWANIEYKEKQKPSKDGTKIYTNYYLESVKAAEGLTTLHSGVVDPPGNPAGTVGTFSAPGVTHNISQKPAKPEYRTPEQIVRDGALKAAVDTAVGLQMADANVRDIINIARSYEAWITDGEKDVVPFETASQSSGDVVDADLVKF